MKIGVEKTVGGVVTDFSEQTLQSANKELAPCCKLTTALQGSYQLLMELMYPAHDLNHNAVLYD